MSSTYNNTKELRFWCQKVLPLVYDDSLSYYELLNKVVEYLNSTIEDVQAMIADVTRIEQGLSSKIDLSQKGVANGVATLNAQGQVPLTQLPDISAGVQTISVNGVNVPADANKNVNIIVMTNAVSNLVNYYLKTETYNKTEVNALIDNVKNSRFEVVAQLPTTDIQTNVIYLIPKSVGQTQNGYDEFINLDGTTSGWELIGSTDIDLSGYVTDSELATALSAYVTTQSLNTTLAGYVTSGALATTLEGYVTQMSFQSLQNTVASQGNTLAGLITTVNGKVDKVTGKGLSTNDYSNADKGIVDKIQDNVIANTKLIKDTVGWSGKNLCPNTANSQTVNGVTFVVNTDKSISVYGTATATFNFVVSQKTDLLHLLNYINRQVTLTGCPSGGSNDTYQLNAVSIDGTDTHSDTDTGNGISFTIGDFSSFINDAVIAIRINNGTNMGTQANPKVFKPMLRDADILDDTYEPYAGTTAFPRSEQAVLGAKNRFNPANYKGGKVPTITDKGKSINIASSDSAAWQGTFWYISVEKNTNYRLVGNAVVTSGGGLLNVKTTDNVTELATTGTFTTNEDIELTFNSRNNTELRVSMFCSLGTASAGDVSYNDISCVLATDPDDTYVPYAMTNKELTEAVTPKTIPVTTDSRTLTKEGVYRYETIIPIGSSSDINLPTEMENKGVTIVVRRINVGLPTTNTLQQIAYVNNQNYFFMRPCNANNWGSWYKFTGTVIS